MKRLIFTCLVAVSLGANPAMAQSFYDDFTDAPSANFASSSSDWEAVWSGDQWNTNLNSNGVAPNTDSNGPGGFGTPADAFDNAIIAGDNTWRDYSVEATFKIADNDTLGIVFRYESIDSYYLLIMSQNEMPAVDGQVDLVQGAQTRLYRIASGVATSIVDPVSTAYQGLSPDVQRIRVEADGVTIRVWVDVGEDPIDTTSTPIILFNDDDLQALSAGKAGLYAFSLGEQVAGTYFDTFRVAALDSDGDGKTNDEEIAAGTDPYDADSDDDGISDGDEFQWNQDFDGDGLINALDWDADNDGLSDGLEQGVTAPLEDTNEAAGNFTPDQDPSTTTDHLKKDHDGGGYSDGDEDLNGNGRYEPELGETDPLNASDDGDYPETDTGSETGLDDTETSDTESDTTIDSTTDSTDSEEETETDSATVENFGQLSGGPTCGCSTLGAINESKNVTSHGFMLFIRLVIALL